jgi:excisionase family DNA binding protein
MSEPRRITTGVSSLVEEYLRLDPAERRRSFLTTRDAAREIGVAQRTLQNWILEGKVEAVRVGGRYLVQVASLETVVCNAADDGMNGNGRLR